MSWQKLPLRRRFKVVNGGTPTSDEENWGSEVSWATPADFPNQFTYLTETRRAITRKGATEGSTIAPEGSILLSTRAPIGYVALTPSKMAFNQGCRALVASGVVDSRYFGYQLSAMTEVLKSRGLGTTFLELSSGNLAELEVMVPPLEEQRRIADFLDAETARIDKLATATQRQATLLGERLQETFREVTTTDGGRGVPTGIAWMPLVNQDWDLNKVSHHFRLGGGTTPPSSEPKYFGEGVRWANSGDVTNGVIESVGKSVTLDAVHDYPSLEVYPTGTLVVALYGQGETKGRVGILGVEACLNQACCALIESGRILAGYAFFWLRAHKAGIISLAVGAGQPNLSQDLIKSLRISAPDHDSQQRILQRLKLEEDHVARLIGRLESRNELLSERRQALITAAVTGEFDVSSASGRGIEE